MSKKEKLIKRFLNNPKDFSFNELVTLLNYFGYTLDNAGKTSGSRVRFYKKNTDPILVHKPHSYKYLLSSSINGIKKELIERKEL